MVPSGTALLCSACPFSEDRRYKSLLPTQYQAWEYLDSVLPTASLSCAPQVVACQCAAGTICEAILYLVGRVLPCS